MQIDRNECQYVCKAGIQYPGWPYELNSRIRKKSRSLQLALGSVKCALRSVDPANLIKNSLQLRNGQLLLYDIRQHRTVVDLKLFESIYLVGAGKGTAKMASAVIEILSNRISGGAINIPYGTSCRLDGIFVTHSSHPTPDAAGVKGTKKMIEILGKTSPSDLVIVLISGGASSLMPYPSVGLSLTEKQDISNSLILSGASIEEVNTVRKHLSKVKGGQLPCYKNRECRLISLIISDVINDRLDVIGSGPTFPDSSSYEDAARVLKKYGLWGRQYPGVRTVIAEGLKKRRPETPKHGDTIFQNVTNILIGNNDVACTAATRYLETRGVQAQKLGTSFRGEARIFGRKLANLAKHIKRAESPSAYVLGGETVVKVNKVKKPGVGGRNQEAILSAAIELRNFLTDKDVTILSVGTDGIDGNSGAAGAFWNSQIITNFKKGDLNDATYFLKTHNSYYFFKKLNSLIVTGRTGTNVNDVSIVCQVE
jgi:glycerate 2-kinase